MGLILRAARRKNLSFLVCLVFVAGIYFILTSSNDYLSIDQPTNDDVKEGALVEYTLPSLEGVANSIKDLNFQRVISQHGSLFDEIPKGTPRVNIIIVSTWRSGSTLLGEILGAYPGVYYHYEPLMKYGNIQIGPGTGESVEVQKTLSSLLQCSYIDQVPYLKHAYNNPDILIRNTRLWTFCKAMPRFKCFMNEIIDKLCSLFPVHVMKLVRARMSLLEPLLHNENVKIVFLVRDPRAVMSSRKLNVDWCSTEDCKSPKKLCTNLEDDFNVYSYLKDKYPNQLKLLRYEDLARNPVKISETVLQFANLTMQEPVLEYLRQHMGSDLEVPWSTIHDPKKQMTKWMKITPWNTVVETQYHCRPIMKLLGYRAFDTQNDLYSGNAVQIFN